MAVFYPPFVDPANATLARVADHIEYIADMTGRRHVGIGSDFDGMNSSVVGLEDASKYPDLVSLAPPLSAAERCSEKRVGVGERRGRVAWAVTIAPRR